MNQPLSLAAEHFLINGTGLLLFCFFRGSPMTVLSEPLALPHFWNFGESLRSRKICVQKISKKALVRYICMYKVFMHLCGCALCCGVNIIAIYHWNFLSLCQSHHIYFCHCFFCESHHSHCQIWEGPFMSPNVVHLWPTKKKVRCILSIRKLHTCTKTSIIDWKWFHHSHKKLVRMHA